MMAPRDSNAASIGRAAPVQGRLFRKYVALFVAVVSVALLANGLLEIYFSYREHQDSLVRIQHEQAGAAAERIGQFVTEIENQMGWTTQLPWSLVALEQRRFDALRLLRQVPAITEFAQLDPEGHEQLRVSRLALDVIGSGTDLSQDPKFTEATAHKLYHGPIYFRRESEPYMTIALAGARRDAGVSVAEVNLKFIWDVVSQIKVGARGVAYVVDADGRLIAHPDISLVLRNTDLSKLPQVAAAGAGAAVPMADSIETVRDPQGRAVLSAHAPVAALGWTVFVELPVEEAYAPLFASLERSGLLLAGGLALAFLAGLLLARRMVIPIEALRSGAARIGGGDLDQRIAIKTGDELEALADQFNDMADRLQDSYAGLEQKVEQRTGELARSVEELRALGVISQVVNSTLDLGRVLETIVAHAVALSGTEAGALYTYADAQDRLELRATHGMTEALTAALTAAADKLHESTLGEAIERRAPVQVADLAAAPPDAMRQLILDAGYRALLVVPLMREQQVFGALVVRRRAPGAFTDEAVALLKTFAAQSVVAIQNARLFREIEEKGRELEIASRHKSQFLANMSHELRTPLNAILGYSELMVDGIYGELPEKVTGVLERVQSNGKHLLGLINDVLDLSKIEAGQLSLSLEDYSVATLVKAVVAGTESLARGKGLVFSARIEEGMPMGRGDERRLTQVLLNLVGNAIKFTDKGAVEIGAALKDGQFDLSVRDTGPGIAEADQKRIFEEFQQVDGTNTRQKGGTGLGLAIARRIVEMHGGRLSVESVLGQGATFRITIPVRAEQHEQVA
jgi:signal transduction histidine kinase